MVLGEGASSQVQLGYNINAGAKVAIKVVQKRVSGSETEQASRKRENAVCAEVASLNYLNRGGLGAKKHCIGLLDSFQDETAFYLVFPYKTGNVYQYLKKHRFFTEEDAKKVFKQLVVAVQYLYGLELAHRDIKIENILLDENTLEVSLCDFGFACHFSPGTKLDEWCGSPFTVAPEILHRIPYSPEAVDVWALGSVLYTMLCGAFPFQASDTKEVYARTKEGRFHHFPSRVSRTAKDLIARCLMVDPVKRLSLAFLRKHPFLWDDDEAESEEEDTDDDEDETSEGSDSDSVTESGDCSGGDEFIGDE